MGLQTSYFQGSRDQALLEKTIGEVFIETAERFADREALVVRHQGIRRTWQQYREEVDQLAAGLLSLGIAPGDRVGIWAPNCYEWCLTQFATARIGAVMVCINPAYRIYELEYALNKVQCRAIVTAERFKTSDYLDMLNSLAPKLAGCAHGKLKASKLPHLEFVIRMGEEQSPGMLNFNHVCAMGRSAGVSIVDDVAGGLRTSDAINIQFTSGTTGTPKGATLSHRNILNNGWMCGEAMRFTEHDRLCVPVPLYHCFGMVLSNLTCMSHGATAVFPSGAFDPLSTLEALADERCTALHGVPTMFIAELDHPEFANFELGSLRTGIMAGAPCPAEVMKRLISDMHMSEILIAYGQTECSPANHITRVDDPVDKRVTTVGRPAPNCEIKLINAEGDTVPIGDNGEICCRGYGVMLGYWDDPEKTGETIDTHGWLHSGDIGVMDEQGYVQVTGRIKDMIIRGGENIYPREVEDFLYTHPDILEVEVFGVPDTQYGEQVCAWIQCREGASLTEAQIKDFCRDQIAHFKVPHSVRFVDEFPMTVTGKIQKFKMRESMEAELDR